MFLLTIYMAMFPYISDLTTGIDLTKCLCLVTAFMLTYFVYLSWSRPKNFPPGPYGWPVLGSLPALARGEPHKVITKLSKQYGDVFGMKLGQRLVVVLNGYDALNEALVKKADYFSGRPSFTLNAMIREGKGAVNSQYDDDGKQLRRFTVNTLKHFGMGKKVLEEMIVMEVHHMMDAIDIHERMSIDLSVHFSNATSNIICSIALGKRYQYNDPPFQRLLIMISNYGKNFLPAFQFLPWKNTTREGKAILDEIKNWIKPDVDEHVNHIDLNSEPRDFLDAYLIEMTRCELKQQPTSVNNANQVPTTLDLFMAGTETTATTLSWAILYLVLHPDVQNRVRAEIIDVVGQDRDISMADKHKLPYMEAVILEVKRISCILPLSLSHITTDDVTLRGYLIPKHTMVIPNLWSAHTDTNMWPEPEMFNPERFLHNGKVVNAEKIVSFSLGPRACAGRQLANAELFLILTTLLQHYEFSPPDGMQPLTTDTITGGTLKPEPYKVCIMKH